MAAAIDQASVRDHQPELQWPRPHDLAQAVIDICEEAARSFSR
jgi:hypothetical protein